MARKKSEKPLLLGRIDGLYLKMTKTKGRGVFCTRDIKKGEEIEVTPTLVLSERETLLMQKTIMRDYIFTLGKISAAIKKRTGVKKVDDGSTIIAGVMTFCNHDEEPNAEIVWEEKNGGVCHTLMATRKIPKDTEICTSYGKDWFDGRKAKSN
jgi:uncharacterized protein